MHFSLSIWWYTIYMLHTHWHSHRHTAVLFFLVFGLVLLVLYFSGSVSQVVKNDTSPAIQSSEQIQAIDDLSVYEKNIKNSFITVPDTNILISLVDGRVSYGTTLDGGDVTLIKLIGAYRKGSVVHVVADMAVQSGGTGVFHYVVLFDVVKEKVTHRSSYFIGDRVVLMGATTSATAVSTYPLTIRYLDRAEDDAMVEDPTIEKTMDITITDGVFVQNEL